jgi:TetR/AcrR family transcriptional regulator
LSNPDVRSRILSAATQLFAHKGYGLTSVREVVATAGVAKPTLYYYFENKEALYLEAVGTQLRLMTELVHRALSTQGTVRSRLTTFVEQYVNVALSNRDGVRLAITATHPCEDERPQIDIMSFHLETIAPMEGLVAEGMKTGELRSDLNARFAVVALIGAATMHLKSALHGIELPPDFAHQIVDTYFSGVGVNAQ